MHGRLPTAGVQLHHFVRLHGLASCALLGTRVLWLVCALRMVVSWCIEEGHFAT